ncbi:hypothetical protein PSACC_01138 [Paramicrosporidium saccamoebae]|uniref:Uncharacterized protein n=1 Tax=Paramicrosporidium saccamoebae TaxID=1246581 RepID=A0A2H9TMS8_9FUNG|nr:hypothetical protein PSACC_01138 [Paramicrosporidium saccamoebae]
MMFTLVLLLVCAVLVLASKTQESVFSIISIDYNTVSHDPTRAAKDLGVMRVDVVGFLNFKDGSALQNALQSHGFKTYHIPENQFLLASVAPLEKNATLGYTYTTAEDAIIVLYGMTGTAAELKLNEQAVANAVLGSGRRYVFFEPSKIRYRKGSMGYAQKMSQEVAGSKCNGMRFDLNGTKPPRGIAKFLRDYFWFLLAGVLVALGIVVFIIVH